MDVFSAVVVMVLCLVVEAFFSGSEMGVVSADRSKLRHAADSGSRGAQLALSMLEKPEWLLSTTLVGTNIAIVTNTTVATALVIDLLGERYSWVAILMVAPLIWIFGEIVAKSVFQHHADAITPKVIVVIRFASILFYPILAAFAVLTRFLAKFAGSAAASSSFTIREEIVTMIEMASVDGDIGEEEQTMIQRVFEFGETPAGEVLQPIVDVQSVERTASCGEATRIAVEHARRRLPVFEGRAENIVGVLDTLELLQAEPDEPIEPFVTPVPFVLAEHSIEDVLVTLRGAVQPVAVVADEYGARGIVTIEDILEEVVGEIDDEYDESGPARQWVRKLAKRDYLASGRIGLEPLKKELGLALPPGSYETLGGYLINEAGDIPAPGSTFRFRKYSLTIEQATERAILEVRIRW